MRYFHWNFTFLTICYLLGFACTNYSSQPQLANPPILLGIETETTGYLIRVSAQNYEFGFAGYRLYEATTEDEVLNLDPLTGLDCGPFAMLPDQASEVFIEVKPDQTAVTPGTTDRICSVSHGLTAGNVIILRTMLFKDVISLSPSFPSNVLVVP